MDEPKSPQVTDLVAQLSLIETFVHHLEVFRSCTPINTDENAVVLAIYQKLWWNGNMYNESLLVMLLMTLSKTGKECIL